MLYDLANYPEWLVGALAIGAVVGWCTYSDAPRRGRIVNWVMWAALFAIGLVIAVQKLVHGRHGLWIEIALLLTGFYILGCLVGGWLNNVLGAHKRAGEAARLMPDIAAWPAPAQAGAGRQPAASAYVAPSRPATEAAAKAEAKPPAAATDAEKKKQPNDTLRSLGMRRPSILLRKRRRRRTPSHKLRRPGRLRHNASPWRPLRKPRPSVLLRRQLRKPKQSAWLLPPRRTRSA